LDIFLHAFDPVAVGGNILIDILTRTDRTTARVTYIFELP